MGFNLNAARKKFTDEEIARRLSSAHGFDFDAATASDPAKFTPTFIAEKLSKLPTPTKDSLQPESSPAPVAAPGPPSLSQQGITFRPDIPTLPLETGERVGRGATGSFQPTLIDFASAWDQALGTGVEFGFDSPEFSEANREYLEIDAQTVEPIIKKAETAANLIGFGLFAYGITTAGINAYRVGNSQLRSLSPEFRVYDKVKNTLGKLFRTRPTRATTAILKDIDAGLLNEVDIARKARKLRNKGDRKLWDALLSRRNVGEVGRVLRPGGGPLAGAGFQPPATIEEIAPVIESPAVQFDPIPPARTRPKTPEPITIPGKPKPPPIQKSLIAAEDDFYEGLAESVDNPFEEPVLSQGGVFADIEAPGAKRPPRMTQAGLVSAKDHGIESQFLEMPELVELAERISGGKTPKIRQQLRRFGGQARGQFNSRTGEITFRADVFEDLEQASSTVAHEIGHMIDWLPDEDIARGNILGRIASLKKFMKGKFLNLASNKVIRDQLREMSFKWRPLPENPSKAFLTYRNSSVELYGDAMSVLLNDPVRLAVEAPDFYDGFFEHLEKKPEVKAVYEDIQNRLRGGRAMPERVDRLRNSFVEADKLYDKELQQPKWLDQLKTSFVDANHAIIKQVKNAGEANVPAGENPRYKLEEMAYTAAEAEAFMSGLSNRVFKPLKQAGLNEVDLGEYMFHRRVIDERSELANPLGWNKKNSTERLFEMRENMEPDQFRALENAANEFWNNRNEMVVSKIVESGIFSPELTQKIQDNVNYATFDVAKFLEGSFGRAATSKIYKQIGTLQKITNPFTATVLKDVSLINTINRNIAAESVVNFLEKFDPDNIRPADKIRGFFQNPKNPKEGMVLFQKGGDLEGFYVNKFIANSFDRNPYEGNFIGKALRATAQPFRTIFTEINPGFWMFNIYRDFFRAAINLPKASLTKFLPFYLKGIKPAFRSSFGIPDDVVHEMLKDKMLISVADFRNASPEDVQIEKLLKRFGFSKKRWDNKIVRPFGKVFNFMQNTGRGFERTTKVASFKYLKKHYPDLTDSEIGHIVRTQGGSPDFMRLGTQYPIYNNAFLFTNAMKEGYRGDFEAAAANPTEFWWKKTKYSFIPKLLMAAAALGLLGDDNKTMMDNVSEYDKSNYHIIPWGLTASGKAVIMRVPVDEGSRFLGGIFWKLINQNKAGQVQNLFDYMAGQAPTLNPVLDAMVAAVQYASGRNPYDAFRGRYAIPERVFEAGGERAHIAFAKWLANKSGSTIVHRFKTDNVEKIKSEIEKVIGLPVVNNIVGRFIKITDQGLSEQLREAKQEVRIQNSRDILDARDALAKLVNGEVLNDQDVVALAKKPDLIDANLTAMLARRHGWTFAQALLSSRSVEERAAVLLKMNELEGRKSGEEINP